MKLQDLIQKLRELDESGYSQFDIEINIDRKDQEFNDCSADLIYKVLSIG